MGIFERFGEYYDLIYREVVDYERECDILERIFAEFSKKTVKNILDVGCGTGSHALIFSNRGYSITGIDISKTMIEKAKGKAEKDRIKAEFFVQDMRNLKLEGRFDCAICMFGGFGYNLTSKDLSGLFSGLNRHLIKDGLFIFEFWNIGGLKPSPYKSWMKIMDKNITLYRFSKSNFDSQTNILDIDMHFIAIRNDKLAETFTEKHRIRCFTVAEIRQYLESYGFKMVSAYDWDAKNKAEFMAPRKETFRVLAVSRKKD